MESRPTGPRCFWPRISGGRAADVDMSCREPSNKSLSTVPPSPSPEWKVDKASCMRSCATRFAPRSSRHVPLRRSFGFSATTMRIRVGPRSSTMPSMTFSPHGRALEISTISPWPKRWIGRREPCLFSNTKMGSPKNRPWLRALRSNNARPAASKRCLDHVFQRSSTMAVSSSSSRLISAVKRVK